VVAKTNSLMDIEAGGSRRDKDIMFKRYKASDKNNNFLRFISYHCEYS
jgi:hypothetical protein